MCGTSHGLAQRGTELYSPHSSTVTVKSDLDVPLCLQTRENFRTVPEVQALQSILHTQQKTTHMLQMKPDGTGATNTNQETHLIFLNKQGWSQARGSFACWASLVYMYCVFRIKKKLWLILCTQEWDYESSYSYAGKYVFEACKTICSRFYKAILKIGLRNVHSRWHVGKKKMK